MKKIVLKKEIFEKSYDELTPQEEENLDMVLYDEFKYGIDRDLYYNYLELPIIDENGLTVSIEKIHDYDTKDVTLSYDFNVEYGVLLTLATDLDYAFYNSDIEIWNTICTDENLVNHDNIIDVYSESIFFLFSDIEEQIFKTSELLTDDDIWEFINYYEYIELIDTDELYNYISLAINELDKWVDRELNRFFVDELYDMYMDNYPYIYNHISELVENENTVEFII